MTSFQFCLPVSDSKIVNLFSDFFPVNNNQLSRFFKIFLVADALARAGRGPGAAAPRPGGDILQFLCISMILCITMITLVRRKDLHHKIFHRLINLHCHSSRFHDLSCSAFYSKYQW